MQRLENCMLCGAASREFALAAPETCMTTNAHFCPCRELEQLDGQIRDFLDQALKKRQELRSRVNHFHSQKVYHIPPEVISHIFLFYAAAVQDAKPVRYFSGKRKLLGPLVLGSICRKWREIAWSTPRLWNSMTLVLAPKSLASKLKVAREWLGRSGQLPLSVSLAMPHRHNSTIATNDLLPLAHLLNQYANRWLHLEFTSIPFPILSALNANHLGLQVLPTYTLQTLRIQQEPDEGYLATSPIVPGLSPVAVEISFVTLPSVGINWSRVTRVEVFRFSVDECIELFRRAPLLTDCKLVDIQDEEQRYPLPDDAIIHNRLTSLHFDFVDCVVDTFFLHLSLPSLLELSLKGGIMDNPLTSFFERSPLLQKLQLKGPIFENDSELVRVLSATPALTDLDIEPYVETEFSLHHLFTRLGESWLIDDPEHFLPKLQCLHYSGYYSDPWEAMSKAFGPISEIKNPRRRPFNKLEFTIEGSSDEEDAEHGGANLLTLMSLREAGIDLKITDSYYTGKDPLEYFISILPQIAAAAPLPST